MSRTVDLQIIAKTHAIMLEYQAAHYQQAPGIRWLMENLKLSSTSVVAARLRRLVDRGLAVKVGEHYVAIQQPAPSSQMA
jgi:DNA-binding HxlR family transcriptional regulator